LGWGQLTRNVLFGLWLPTAGKYGSDLPGPAQNLGPNTPLTLLPVCCRSP
jgi:hypothetical protein